MNNRIKMTDSKFKCNIFLFLSVTVFMARLSNINIFIFMEELDSPAVSALGVRSRKLSNALNGQSWDG
jgi:hypothetical protein